MAQSTKQNGHLVPSNSTVTTWTTPFVMTERKPFLANRIFDTFNALCEFVNNTSAAGEGTDATDGLTLSVVNDNDKSKNGLYYVAMASGDGGNGTTNSYIIQRVVTSNFSGGTGSGVDNTVQVGSMISEGSYIVSGNKDISNSDKPENGIKVITGIYTTSDGKISYSYSYIYDPHDDHKSTGTAKTKVTFGKTDASTTKVITNLKMGADGSLSYTYIDLEYDKDHHETNTGKYNEGGNKDLSNVDNVASGIKVITGVNLSTSGTLSYSYSYIYNPHDDHSGSKSSNTYTTLTEDNVEVISSVSLSADGTLSGTVKKLTHGNAGKNVGTYGLDATKSYTLDNAKFFVPELTVNAHGHVTAASEKTVTVTHPTTYTAQNTFLDNANITITSGGSFKIPQWKTNTYGHMSSYQVDTVTLSHGNPNSNSGTYGLDATKSYTLDNAKFFVPEFTVNAQGHITSASEKTVTVTHPTTYTAQNTFLDNADITITSGGSFKIPQWKTNTYGHMSSYQVDTVTLSHGNPNSNSGTYGLDATKSYTLDNAKFFVPELTVNAHGHVTAASEKTVTVTHPTTYTAQNTFLDNANITITSGGSFKIPQWKTNTYGHVSSYQVDTVTLSHGNSGVTSGTYGSAGTTLQHGQKFNIPKFTVNTQGHITAVSNETMTLPSSTVSNVTTSLFTGDNGVTYMLTNSNGSITITQPIKRIYTTANIQPSSPNTNITYSDSYVCSTYSITSESFGYTGVGDEIITIEFNGNVPVGTTVESIPITYNTNKTGTLIYNTHFTYSVSGANLNIKLIQDKVRKVSKSVPNIGSFGFGNVSASTTVYAYNFVVSVNIGGNKINLSTSLASNTSSRTVTPKCYYYISYIFNNNTELTNTLVNCSSSISGRPSKLEINKGVEDLKFIFPSIWGTPKFYQMNAQILDWKYQGTKTISTKGYSMVTNTIDYKVYYFGSSKAGSWDITW